MHEEELAQTKRVNAEREDHLEKRIIEFEKQREEIYRKAKEEATKEEKRKRAKF